LIRPQTPLDVDRWHIPQRGERRKWVFSELTTFLQDAFDEGVGEGVVREGDLEGFPEGILGIASEEREDPPQVVGGVARVVSTKFL